MSDCADESFNLPCFLKNISDTILNSYVFSDFSEVMRAFFSLYSKNKTFIHFEKNLRPTRCRKDNPKICDFFVTTLYVDRSSSQ